MNKVLVSSTPHPKRNHHRFTDLFDDDPVSPITQLDNNPVHKQPVKICISKVKSVKQVTRKNPVLPQNKKNEECASSAVLRELGAVGKTHRMLLSHSRNLYNMYPELIIVDSDEDDTEASSPIDKPQVKKMKRVTKSNAKTGTSAEDSSIKQRANSNPELNGKDRPQRRGASKVSDKTIPLGTVNQGPPLDCSENIPATKTKKIVKKSRKAPISKDSSTIVINSGDESKLSRDSVLDNVMCSQKKQCIKLPIIEDLSEEEIITFTPRRIKSNKNKIDTAVTVEESNSNVDKVENNLENMSEIVNTVQQCDKKLPPRRCKKITEIAQVDKKIEHPKNDNNCMENSFPKGCVSHFKDVVFKHSMHTGGITANCLKTEKLNFGYIEVTGVFEGKRSNITFTVLEGEVVATWMGASQKLSPGDILHVNTDSGYKFQNVGDNSYARLLYIKENHP
ncbi:uncharacterized protein LOC124364872 [Homalodisca vitripennis]|uniref:uncharacterized protein LOC124364872 n=1 Tax=Homalodisca vitripennis TaxID=197043 RepID=UPI001EEBE368|nr:uncharacterized protein LOC124364872 [Homalodisca vitripennis]XP_046676621.1 uncharacterized protein LOC124364872 [Homalodisca vitripennis]